MLNVWRTFSGRQSLCRLRAEMHSINTPILTDVYINVTVQGYGNRYMILSII